MLLALLWGLGPAPVPAWAARASSNARLEGKGMGGFDAQRLVHAGRILDNDETLMAAGVAKQPQVRMW